jgi:CRISPR-associated protein Csm1
MTDLPTIDELGAGAFLHDIGKLEQRADPDERELPPSSRRLEDSILPTDQKSQRKTHRHALFSDGFFEWAMDRKAWPPRGLDLKQAQVAAIYHHRPDEARPWTWLVAEADRLSSGMDRKERDAQQEADLGHGGRARYRTTPLESLVTKVRLDLREPRPASFLVAPLEPDGLFPVRDLERARLPEGYVACRDGFRDGFRRLAAAHAGSVALFHEGLMALSERFCWAVPSSTMDQPDVSLHDHAHSVAAIASAAYAWHAADGSLGDAGRIKDRKLLKYRLLEGDLSGIQSTLFRLARQQVKGVSRILRARSFLMGALIEAAALLIRRELGLPPYVVLQRAGGKFLMLVPNLPAIETTVEMLRCDIDRWLVSRYAGDLALNLALGPAFSGEGFLKANWPQTLAGLRGAADAAKLQPLRTGMTQPVLDADYEEGADGHCPACGVRPRKTAFSAHGVIRCAACHAEHEIGRILPNLKAVLWAATADPEPAAFVPFDSLKLLPKDEGARPAGNPVSAWQPFGGDAAWPVTARFVANHVPRFSESEWDAPRYRHVDVELADIDQPETGAIKTLAYLARDDLEEVDGQLRGRPMLAVVKADVDRLGQVFTKGLGEDRTVGRVVALSRLIDGFFTGWLTHLLGREFPNVYTVYAGGDDLLLIGPWLTTIKLAQRLNQDFREFSNENPNLTLSAGIELLDPAEPLNRAVARAEERLEAAKESGRNRVGLIVEQPIDWNALDELLRDAAWLNDRIRDPRDPFPLQLVYKILHFADLKARADGGDSDAAIWQPRLRYHLARAFPDRARHEEVAARIMTMLGPAGEPRPARIPLTIALYRNR